MYEIHVSFPIDGDKELMLGLVGLLARDLPSVLHPSCGLSRFKPPHSAFLRLEVFAEDAPEAVEEAMEKVRIALELRSWPIPAQMSIAVAPLEEAVAS